MPVLGIGGLFFRARDPDALARWYKQHLGIGPGCAAPGAGEADEWTWAVQGGPLAFQPFAADSDYFATDKAWMLNLRVSGLDAMLDELRVAGVDVVTSPDWDQPGIGRFARIHDPEGNAVELWEAAG